MAPLENQHLNEDEFKIVEAVLILFAKVIKQDPLQYMRLNSLYFQVMEMRQENKIGQIFDRAASMQYARGRQSHGYAQHQA